MIPNNRSSSGESNFNLYLLKYWPLWYTVDKKGYNLPLAGRLVKELWTDGQIVKFSTVAVLGVCLQQRRLETYIPFQSDIESRAVGTY